MKKPPRLVSSKKAQDASAAATLVAVIALLIIFYLLFIPPSYRDQILEGNTSSSSGSSAGSGVVLGHLLKASPGTLSPIKAEEIEHNIPSITLYAKTNSQVLQTVNSVFVKSSIFGQKKATVTFNIQDLPNTKNVLLTMANKRIGATVITKHGKLVGVFTYIDACRYFGEYIKAKFPNITGNDAA